MSLPSSFEVDLEQGTYEKREVACELGDNKDQYYVTTSSTSSSDVSICTSADSEKNQVSIEHPRPAYLSGIKSIHTPQSSVAPLPLPLKNGPKWLRNFRWLVFTTYRRLFTLAFIANVTVLVGLAACKNLDYSSTATAAAVNLVVSILMRQEHVINLIFWLGSAVPTWLPLSLRCYIAKVYCYGGMHSGCGIAAAAWYIAFTAYLTSAATSDSNLWPAAGMAYAILVMLILIVTFAYPTIRMKMHDYFEMMHRFAGWAVVAIYWAQIMVLNNQLQQSTHASFGHLLIHTPAFWCICIITVCLFYPWIRLRHREVYVEKLSQHAARLHFTHSDVDRCIGVRLSTRPLFESHSFATIPAAPPEKGFSCVISHAGDWTRSIIREQTTRTKIWMKGAPVYGVLRTAMIFKRTVIVATGSGIGPCLSLLNANDNIDCRVLWSTKAPLATYGEGIVNAVLGADPRAKIWDTGKQGRPDMVQMTYDLYKESGAEAVFLISNPAVTRKLIYGMEARGVPAFAPIFDS